MSPAPADRVATQIRKATQEITRAARQGGFPLDTPEARHRAHRERAAAVPQGKRERRRCGCDTGPVAWRIHHNSLRHPYAPKTNRRCAWWRWRPGWPNPIPTAPEPTP